MKLFLLLLICISIFSSFSSARFTVVSKMQSWMTSSKQRHNVAEAKNFTSLVSTSYTVCQKGYKYGAPINVDGQTTVHCDAESSCHSITAEIVINNDILETATRGKINIGQCVSTRLCDRITCNLILRYMPSNLRGVIESCDATCCKGGSCRKLSSYGKNLKLPGPSSPVLPQRPIEYPSFTRQTDVPNPLLTSPNHAKDIQNSDNICKKGFKFGAPINADGQTNGYCDASSSCHIYTVEIVHYNDILGTVTRTSMDSRTCTKTSACQLVTCGVLRRITATHLRESIGSCSASCCKNGICRRLTENAKRLRLPSDDTTENPIKPKQELILRNDSHIQFTSIVHDDGDDGNYQVKCTMPEFSEIQKEDNWSEMTRRGKKQPSKFSLFIHGLIDGHGYKPSKTYKLVIRGHNEKTRAKKLFIAVSSNSTDCSCYTAFEKIRQLTRSCLVGKLLPNSHENDKVSYNSDQCNGFQVAELDAKPFSTQKHSRDVTFWKAPACNDGMIMMRVYVLGTDDVLYADSESHQMSNQYLTKYLRPSP